MRLRLCKEFKQCSTARGSKLFLEVISIMSIQFDKAQQRSAVDKKALQYDVARIERIQIPGQGELILAVVADGDNEEPKSPLAADVAVRAVFNHVRRTTTTNLKDALKHALTEANNAVWGRKSEDELAPEARVSLTAVALINKQFYVAHIGNNGLYLVRHGKDLKKLTNNNGGQTHDFLGLASTIQTPSILTETLEDGDQLVIYTDGFSFDSQPSKLENELIDALSEPTLNGASRRLVSYPMGRNVDDNVSVIVIRASNGVQEIIQKNIPVVIGLGVVMAVVMLALVSAALLLFSPGRFSQPTSVSYGDSGTVVILSENLNVNGKEASNVAQVRAGDQIRNISGDAYLNLPSSSGLVYLGPDTAVELVQLASVKSGEEKHVIIFVSRGVVAAKLSKLDYRITLRFGGGDTILSGKTNGGMIAVNALDNRTVIDCVEGICVVGITGREPMSLEAGQMVIRTSQGVVIEDLTPEKFTADMIAKMNNKEGGSTLPSPDQAKQIPPTIIFATNENLGLALTVTATLAVTQPAPVRPATTPTAPKNATVVFRECNDKEGSISFDGAPSISLHANKTVEFINITPGEHRYKTNVPSEPYYNESQTIQVKPGVNIIDIGKTCRQ